MLPNTVKALENTNSGVDGLRDAVANLSVADVEGLSITDISALESNQLKDLLNDAIRSRLESHKGGTYTSPARMSIRELEASEAIV